MKEPGFKSLAAKSPNCPFAGCEGSVMGDILTRVHVPRGVLGGTCLVLSASLGRVRRMLRCVLLRVGE